jgi:hypothetical protein
VRLKPLSFLLIVATVPGGIAAAQAVPLPKQRPVVSAPEPQAGTGNEAESACRLRLTDNLARAPSLPAIDGPGECGAADVVLLESIVLPNRKNVAVTPPAVLRCTFAEEIVRWVREDVAPAASRALGSAVKSIDNFAAYDCRGRNRVAGAKVSEHGKGNALDVRSLTLAGGTVVHLTDPNAPKDLRETLRKRTCARFMTVLGPGSDGYHEDHIHVDLAERAGGHRMCQWQLHEAGEETATARIPLPRPRPRFPE